MNRRSLIIVVTLAVAVGVVASSALYHWRPLVESPDFSVSYAVGTSAPLTGTAYRMLFRPDRVFVRLPDDAQSRYSWIAVDLSRRFVAIPNAPDATPYLHFNHDMPLGVAVDDAVKLTTPWTVVWSESGFTASDGASSVQLECR